MDCRQAAVKKCGMTQFPKLLHLTVVSTNNQGWWEHWQVTAYDMREEK